MVAKLWTDAEPVHIERSERAARARALLAVVPEADRCQRQALVTKQRRAQTHAHLQQVVRVRKRIVARVRNVRRAQAERPLNVRLVRSQGLGMNGRSNQQKRARARDEAG